MNYPGPSHTCRVEVQHQQAHACPGKPARLGVIWHAALASDSSNLSCSAAASKVALEPSVLRLTPQRLYVGVTMCGCVWGWVGGLVGGRVDGWDGGIALGRVLLSCSRQLVIRCGMC